MDQKNQPPTSTAELRINASPAIIAVRYDANHVVFKVATDSESRFRSASEAPCGGPPRLSGLDRRCWRCIRDLSPASKKL
jgi:hypothetical protein